MQRLARFLKPFKKEVLLGPLFKLTEAVFELIVPLVMAAIIDAGVNRRDIPYILRMGGMMVLLGVVGLLCALTCQYFAARASQGFGTKLRGALFSHINTFSHAQIDKMGTSSLITRVTNDVNQLQVAVAMLIRLVIRAPFLVVGAAVMAMLLDLRLSLVFLVAAPLVALVLYLVMSRSVPFYRTIQKKLDRIALLTRESLGGARVIRAFSRQQSERAKFGEASDDLARSAIHVGKISALLNPSTSVILNLAIAAILWFGGMRVYSGALTQGQIIAFVNYITQISLALVVVANLVVIFTKAAASAARVNEVLDLAPDITDPPGAAPAKAPPAGAPAVEFSNVSFAYSGAAGNAIEGVNLRVMPGETVGIIGGTGSGKSTLVSLVPRFYEATRGAVLVQGRDVRQWPLAALRGVVAVVPQQAALVSGTVRENLLWGNRGAGEEELRRALRVAQAADFVERLPKGLDTMISQGGKNLSGGQKQRLTIARALTGRPRVLILDDSASALDFATDLALRRALRRETAGMAVLLVSQRASTIRRADKIVVLDDGRVAGIGTHEALLKSCQVYQEICQSQLGGQEKNQGATAL